MRIVKLDPKQLQENQVRMNKRGKIIGSLMIAGSLLLTIVFGFSAWRSIQILNWNQTEGIVTYSFANSNLNDERKAYFDYEYTVDGIKHTGKESDIGKFVDTPPLEGQTITVYYNPQNPSDSAVESNKGEGLSDLVNWVCCFGPFFLIFGAILLFVSTRKQTPPAQQGA